MLFLKNVSVPLCLSYGASLLNEELTVSHFGFMFKVKQYIGKQILKVIVY